MPRVLLDLLTARNTAPDSENRMHEDGTAAAYGFRGGLVPGVTVYGYMAAPLGPAFLEHGGMSLRLLRPFYDGDEVIIEQPDAATILAINAAGETCARGMLRTTPPPAIDDFPAAPLPEERPAASAATLAPGTIPGTLHSTPAAVEAGLLLELSNRVLMANVLLSPWIHAASELQHFTLPRPGEELATRARVAELYEKKGHRFVVLEVLVLGVGLRLIQHVRHTAIYEPKRA